jgi:hypothetical protein
LGEAIGFLCTLADTRIIGGGDMTDVVLRQVKNRLSMSVVFDSLTSKCSRLRSTNHYPD